MEPRPRSETLHDSDYVPLTEAVRSELDRRIEEYERDPSATRTWAEVRKDLETGSNR